MARWSLRGGYGIFYDSGTLIENSALYFNPPYFTLQLFFPGAQPLRLENPFPAGRGFTPRATVNTLDPERADGIHAAGQPRRSKRNFARHLDRGPLRHVVRRQPGAEAQHESAAAGSGTD